MSSNFNSGWYVLYVKSRHEKKVKEKLMEKGYEVFLPLIKKLKQWKDRKKVVQEPLFKSYVFVKIENSKKFYTALTISGACSYIKFGDWYAKVNQIEINNIKKLINLNDIKDISIVNRSFRNGQTKLISTGILKGLECEIVESKNNNKILVRIDSLYQTITAVVPESHLLLGNC